MVFKKIVEFGNEIVMIGMGFFMFMKNGVEGIIVLVKNLEYYVIDKEGKVFFYFDSVVFIVELRKLE